MKAVEVIADAIWSTLAKQAYEGHPMTTNGYVAPEMNVIDGHFDIDAVAEAILRELTGRVDRFEVISEAGRLMVNYDVSVALDLQDDGRTLKVFMRKRQVKG